MVDGDTVWAEDAYGTKLRIRLVGIDAPELAHPRKAGGTTPGQRYWKETRRAVAHLLFKQSIQAEVYGRDRHGHLLGVVHHGPTNANLWLVRSGLAWYYRGGRKDAPPLFRRELEAAEAEARRGERGLWADPNAEPPWLYRRRMRIAG